MIETDSYSVSSSAAPAGRPSGRLRSGVPADGRGFTLVEVLVAVLIVGLVVASFQGILSSFLQSHEHARNASEILNQGRFAMARMSAMVRETEAISFPELGNADSLLTVSERMLDITDNAALTFAAGGDGLPDADNDADGLTNNDDDGSDDAEPVSFTLDTSDGDNWKLVEVLPDYTTSDMDDAMDPRTLCEHVTGFVCTRLSSALVEIELTLEHQGRALELTTRALAGRVGS